ncbi:MAG: hypothetical protein HFI09_01230 [Bacilli bacterium]|nr:hypothetical protein [Bacilli bacterium]
MDQQKIQELIEELVLAGKRIWDIYLKLMTLDPKSISYQKKMEHLALAREYEDKLYAQLPINDLEKISSYFEHHFHLKPISLVHSTSDELNNLIPFYRIFLTLRQINVINQVPDYISYFPNDIQQSMKKEIQAYNLKSTYFSNYHYLTYMILNQDNPKAYYRLLFFERMLEKESLSRPLQKITLSDAYDYIMFSPGCPQIFSEERETLSGMYKGLLQNLIYDAVLNATDRPSKEETNFLLACFYCLTEEDQDEILLHIDQLCNSKNVAHLQKGILFCIKEAILNLINGYDDFKRKRC